VALAMAFHRCSSGDVSISGYLADCAFIIWGLLELYESTFSPAYLQKAIDLNRRYVECTAQKLFTTKGYYFPFCRNSKLFNLIL